jgi:hypothetical protein
MTLSSPLEPAKQGTGGELPCRHLGRALAPAMRLRFLIRNLVHDLDNERYPV